MARSGCASRKIVSPAIPVRNDIHTPPGTPVRAPPATESVTGLSAEVSASEPDRLVASSSRTAASTARPRDGGIGQRRRRATALSGSTERLSTVPRARTWCCDDRMAPSSARRRGRGAARIRPTPCRRGRRRRPRRPTPRARGALTEGVGSGARRPGCGGRPDTAAARPALPVGHVPGARDPQGARRHRRACRTGEGRAGSRSWRWSMPMRPRAHGPSPPARVESNENGRRPRRGRPPVGTCPVAIDPHGPCVGPAAPCGAGGDGRRRTVPDRPRPARAGRVRDRKSAVVVVVGAVSGAMGNRGRVRRRGSSRTWAPAGTLRHNPPVRSATSTPRASHSPDHHARRGRTSSA